jgi:hypothetical protein
VVCKEGEGREEKGRRGEEMRDHTQHNRRLEKVLTSGYGCPKVLTLWVFGTVQMCYYK